jgi:hypothetical protein
MNFPPLPEVPELSDDKLPTKEQLVALRQTLERVRQELDQLSGLQEERSTPSTPKPCLFEARPTVFESLPMRPVVRTVIEPVESKSDALLEKATLDELNMTLGLAFAQIASKRVW